MLLEAHGSDEGVYAWLETLRTTPTAEARAELLKLMGVGRKVADCVLLMSMDKVRVLDFATIESALMKRCRPRSFPLTRTSTKSQ